MPVSKLDTAAFAQKIKEKYPDYKDVDDGLLTRKILEKHPEYKDVINDGPKQSPVDQGTQQTSEKLNRDIQFNGTFQPDLEGEKKGLYLNDADYQKQKQDFVGRIFKDDNGNPSYPEQDKQGNWFNYYTKDPIKDFDPNNMRGKVLQVPHEYLPATGGKKFITPIYNKATGNYDFPDVETPSVPHINELPEATVYGSKKGDYAAIPDYSPAVKAISEVSKNQGGKFDQVLKNHPELAGDIDNTLKKYGDEYTASLATGSKAMTNVVQKAVEDKYGLNEPMPSNVDPKILDGHMNVLNAFDENRKKFEDQQKDLQRQADLMQDKAKREGVPITQSDADRLNQKAEKNAQNWSNYTKSVNFSQNYMNQPEVKDYLDKVQKKQQGLKILDEVRQRSFPADTQSQISQDEYSRKGIEGNLNLWDYLKTFGGRAAAGISNMTETYNKIQGIPAPIAEGLNNQRQEWIGRNLPQLAPEAIEEMSKGHHGLSLALNDLAATAGSFAPYIIPGMAGEGLGAKAATFAASLAASLPEVKKQALDLGLTGKAYNTFLTAKPLIDAAFMSFLPSAKIAKGFEGNVAKAIVDGEYNSPKRFLLNLATKAFSKPEDIAHMQAMLSGTEVGNAFVNSLTNTLQAGEDMKRGMTRQGELPVNLDNIFNPRQTITAVLAGKILESVPTIVHGANDFTTLKGVGKSYEHAENNMVELAANDLKGATDKISSVLKKDPSNLFAQHIKQTLEDFADAKSKMPEGLSPEQQTAIFDLRRKIATLERQHANSSEDYKDHITKNIEELKKQIPPIIDNQKVALKYLQPAHDEFVNNIQSQKPEENGNDETDAAQAKGREEITTGEGAVEAGNSSAPSYLVSRHADTIKDEQGKVSGPNQNPLSADGRKDANDLANEVQAHAEKTGVPVTKIIHSGLERAGETARTVAEKTGAKTIADSKLNTWDIKDFDDVGDDEFKEVQKWFGKNPNATEYKGDIDKFKGKSIGESLNEYAQRTINAHAKYGNDPVSTLLIDHSNNMMVMDAFRKNGNKWDENAIHDYLNAEKPEPATLDNKTSTEPAPGKSEGKTVGISHSALENASERLGLGEPQRGKVLQPEEYVQRGRDLIKSGADPQEVADDFKKDGKISADAVSVVRAYNESLELTADHARKEFGENSPEFKKASSDIDKWQKEVAKPMGTAWAEVGRSFQGATDLNTGSFVAMKRAVEETTGKDLTPEQSKKIDELSGKVASLTQEVDGLKQKLTEVLDKSAEPPKKGTFTERAKSTADTFRKLKNKPFSFKDENGKDIPFQKMGISWNDIVEVGAKAIEASGKIADGIAAILDHVKDADWYKGLSQTDKDAFAQQLAGHYGQADTNLAERFVDKKDNKFSPEDAKDIWEYAKENYVDKDVPFNDMIKNVATDLGLNGNQIMSAIVTPKGAKEVTVAMFKKQYERNKAMQLAKEYVKTTDNSATKKFVNMLPSAFFNLKTYGHGTVGFITHAGPNIFRPSVWGSYWPNALKQFSFAYGNTGKYEMAIQGLRNSPNFDVWNQAGLAVDPKVSYDEYQMFGKKMSWLGEAGTRGFNALKFLRYDMAETFYNRASASEKADPSLREHIAELVNHATGHSEIKIPSKIAKVFFAPGLEISRWQRMIIDPAQAANTVLNWNKKSPAEQAAAKIVFAGAGEKLATYAALLAANAGLLTAMRSKQQINLTDPSKSDWLKFKAGDKTIDFTGGILNPLRLLSVVGHEAVLSATGNKKELKTKPGDKDASTLASQVRYKLSPIAGEGADMLTGTDAMGNPLPWSNVPPGPGRHKMDWTEYGTMQLPIPIEAGVKAAVDGMRERGVSKLQINDIMNGLLQFGVEGFTGVKMAEDYSLQQKPASTGHRQRQHQ